MVHSSFDYVFHYAATVGVLNTLEHPDKVLHDLEGFKNIFTLAKNTGVQRVFFSSSAEVYGEPVEIPQDEESTALNARLPYAVVKHMGEVYAEVFQQLHGLDYTIFRFFNTYGPKQSPNFVVSKFITAALANQPITIYGDGEQNRSFCFIEDNLDVTTHCLYKGKAVNEVVNIGNDRITTINELAHLIIKLTKSKSKVEYIPALPAGDMSRRQPAVRKMKKLLDREYTTLEEGLAKTITYFRNTSN